MQIKHSRVSIQSPFPAALRFIQKFIDAEHVCRILLELHRPLSHLLLPGTFESYLCLPESESVVIQCTPDALLRTTPKLFLIPFRDIAARLVYRCRRGGAMKEWLIIQAVRFFIPK